MIGKLLGLAALAQMYIVAAQRANGKREQSVTAECMQTTKEVGAEDSEGLTFQSNMDDLVNDLQEKVLYMRTTDIKVCYGSKSIHGMRVALKHDIEKDPAHNEFLDTFYSHEGVIVEDYDRKFYEHMVGEPNGTCTNMHMDKGVKITAIRIRFAKWIRSIEFKKSDGTIDYFGEEQKYVEGIEDEIINLTQGEEIVGIYGKFSEIAKTPFTMSQDTHHFASMGFILNRCGNERLTSLSFKKTRDATAAKLAGKKHSRRGGKADGMLIAVVALSIILGMICIYTCLKNRGQCCKKKQSQDQSFNEVSQNSTAKKQAPGRELVG